jgi:hypothetical protein
MYVMLGIEPLGGSAMDWLTAKVQALSKVSPEYTVSVFS